MSTESAKAEVRRLRKPVSEIRDSLNANRSKELVFAVVGYAGSGTSWTASRLIDLFEKKLNAHGFVVHRVKARDLLDQFIGATGALGPTTSEKISVTEFYQAQGDRLRDSSGEYGAVAAYAIRRIHELRNPKADTQEIFVIDSLKHPDEVELLRKVYGEAFCLVGVACRPDIRERRLARKFDLEPGELQLKTFISRDAEDSVHKYGQHVNDAFHLSDYFVDNTPNYEDEKTYRLPDQLKLLYETLFLQTIHRPSADESGMYYAHASAMRSSCLSRQVGASIISSAGILLAVGANEVPKYGGGSYDGSIDGNDHRCFKAHGYCSNVRQQIDIVRKIYGELRDSKLLQDGIGEEQVAKVLRGTRIRSLIEFSRSVHAEMDALISLVRSGTKLEKGAALFSTTYPCHSCARHIVAAGLERVVYLEPYSKSLAIDLHRDAIADNESPEQSVGKVTFSPYVGISPQLFRRIYLKQGDLKDDSGNMLPRSGASTTSSVLWRKTYTDLERDIVEFIVSFEKGGAP